jgi:hypothetical protein
MTDTLPLPPLKPPQLWSHGGKIFYFGPKTTPPDGAERGDPAQYAQYYKEQMARREQQIREAERNLQREIEERKAREENPSPVSFLEAPAFEPERERLGEPRSAVDGLRDGDPSPFSPRARVSFSPRIPPPAYAPPPAPRPSMNQPPSYESVLLDHQNEAMSITLKIYRIFPDAGDQEDINLFEHSLDEFDTLGKVTKYLKDHLFDGRQTRFRVSLLIDSEIEGPWLINLSKDKVRLAETEAEQEQVIANIRRAKGLPPISAPPALGAVPPAMPPGYVSAQEAEAQVNKAILEAEKRWRELAGLPAPGAPPPAPAPPAPVSREELAAMIKEAVAATIPAPAPPPPPEDAATTLKKATEQATSTMATLAESQAQIRAAAGIPDAPEAAAPEDPTIERNGITIPKDLFKSNPSGAMLACNLPIVQALLTGVKDGARELIQEVGAARRAELENEQKALEIRERQLALAERSARVKRELAAARTPEVGEGAGGVVESPGEWAPPRARKSAHGP